MKIVNYFILIVFCGLMFFAAAGLPERGDPNAPMNRPKSRAGSTEAAYYYIQHAKEDAHTDNMVTVILADYRGYDTLGEETVIYTAVLICFLLLRKQKKEETQ